MNWNQLGVCAALAICLSAADDPKKKTGTPSPAPAKPAPAPVKNQAAPKPVTGAAGAVVAKDPDGALRMPTATEQQALTGRQPSSLTAGTPSTPVELGAGRGTMVVLNPEESNVFMVVTKGPDGKLILSEATGRKAAEKAIAQPPAPRKVESSDK